MRINEDKDAQGTLEYHVEFEEHRLEDVVKRLNRLQRADEKPFEAVAAISEFNQRAYELFAQPLVQATSSELGAKVQEVLHPLRLQRWAISDLNPALAWLASAAAAVRAQRRTLGPEAPARKAERALSGIVSAGLDYYRGVRDAMSEAAFFQVYGNLFSLYLADRQQAQERQLPQALDPRELPVVKEALAAISEGGYAEAIARVGSLLAFKGQAMPLERLHARRELIEDYRELLPATTPHEQRRIRGEQDIIVRYEPEQALATLPQLVRNPADRKRLLTLLERLLADKRIQGMEPTAEQRAMVERIEAALRAAADAGRAVEPVRPAA